MTCQQFLHSPPIVYCQIYDEVNFVKLLFGIICFENPIPKVRIVITKVMYLLNEVVSIRYLVPRAISFLIGILWKNIEKIILECPTYLPGFYLASP